MNPDRLWVDTLSRISAFVELKTFGSINLRELSVIFRFVLAIFSSFLFLVFYE